MLSVIVTEMRIGALTRLVCVAAGRANQREGGREGGDPSTSAKVRRHAWIIDMHCDWIIHIACYFYPRLIFSGKQM